MNSRNSFSSLTITQLVIHLTGALLELYADDTQEIQVMASGDDHDMKAVSLAQNGDTLTLDMKPDALVSVRCGDVTLTEGRMGRVGDKVAVRVAKQLRRPTTTFAMFETAGEKSNRMEATS